MLSLGPFRFKKHEAMRLVDLGLTGGLWCNARGFVSRRERSDVIVFVVLTFSVAIFSFLRLETVTDSCKPLVGTSGCAYWSGVLIGEGVSSDGSNF